MRWSQSPVTVMGEVNNNYFIREETNFPNGDLMWNNLLNDFWIYQRQFLVGSINGKFPPSTFESQNRTKKQRQLSFPRLQPGPFDPYKLITTNLGNGQVAEFDVNTDTDFITVSLIY